MAVTAKCDCDGEETPIYRLSAVILDGRLARVCPHCAAKYKDRIEMPYDFSLPADPNEGEQPLGTHRYLADDLGLENLLIEANESLGFVGQNGDMVIAV